MSKFSFGWYLAGYFHGAAVCAILQGYYWQGAKIGSAGVFIIIAMVYLRTRSVGESPARAEPSTPFSTVSNNYLA